MIGHPRTSVITVNNTGPSCAVDRGAFLKEFQLRFRHIVSQPRTMRPIYSYEFTVAALAGNTAPNVNPPRETVDISPSPVTVPLVSVLV